MCVFTRSALWNLSFSSFQLVPLQAEGGCFISPPVIFTSLLFPTLPSSSPLCLVLSREFVTAVKPCIKALTYDVSPHLPLFLPPWLSPSTLCWSTTPPLPSPLQACSAAATQLSAADVVELITVSFICRLAAQRDLGIDQMPADWWLLNRLLFTPATLPRGWREEGRGIQPSLKVQQGPNWQADAMVIERK